MTRESDADPVHYCDWLALLGFMKEQDALLAIKGQGIENLDEAKWSETIRKANRAASHLISGRRSAKPEVRELDPRFRDRENTIRSDPTFPEHLVGVKRARFALVELAKLRCFQTQLNMEYIASLTASAPSPENIDATVRFCLPTAAERAEGKIISATSMSANTSALVSENLDFRVVGKIDGEDARTGRRYTGFGFGFGLPQMAVAEHRNQLFIKNGYHRAYALLKRGHEFLPCLLTETDDFQSLGFQGRGFFPLEMMLADWAPLLTDFGTDAAVAIPRRRTRVVITVHAETQVVPV